MDFPWPAVCVILTLYFFIYLVKSKRCYALLCTWLNSNCTKKVVYNPKVHDPEIKGIDGNGNCYPNCASDIWLRSCENEIIEPIEGHVSGHIPLWLNGSLLRNGPGAWKVGEMTFNHLFDCSALLHRFAIKNGHVTYQNRFILTETWKKNHAAQRIVVTEFGTASVPDPCHSIFDKVSAIFHPENGSDNSMISIYPMGDEYFSFTEAPFIHKINPRTLATEKRICLTDFVGVISHTSHPHVMPNGTVYNLGMGTGMSGPAYNIICFPHGESMFEDAYVVGSIPTRWKLNPGYMHTFGITENYFVVVEQPLSVSLPEYIKAQINNHNLSSCLKWFENKPTLFHLMERDTGKLAFTYEADAFFYLHIVNQYEENNHVVVDICCYKNPEMINCMYLDAIMNMQSNPNYAEMFRGSPQRYVLPLSAVHGNTVGHKFSMKRRLSKSMSLSVINRNLQQPKLKHSASYYENNNQNGNDADNELKSENLVTLEHTKATAYYRKNGKVFVRSEQIVNIGCETPRINYDLYLGKKYRYFYAISSDVDGDNPGTLIKVDVYTKSCKTWSEMNCYPSEPIFVPSPNAQAEDDGVVLASMVFAGLNDNHVALLVLCAKTWTELGRCDFHTNGPVPKCLHGWFANNIV